MTGPGQGPGRLSVYQAQLRAELTLFMTMNILLLGPILFLRIIGTIGLLFLNIQYLLLYTLMSLYQLYIFLLIRVNNVNNNIKL